MSLQRSARRALVALAAAVLLAGCAGSVAGSPVRGEPPATTTVTTAESTPAPTTTTPRPEPTPVIPPSAVSSAAAPQSTPTTPATPTQFGQESALLDSAADGSLVIGIKFDQPGIGQQLPDGTFAGFDVEVATSLAQSLGVPAGGIEFVEARSASREQLITSGDVDFIVATYSITDKRKEVVNFAGPYFVAAQDLLIRSNDSSIVGPETLGGKKLCSVTGSTPAHTVKDNYAADVVLVEFASYFECVTALRAGAVDAVTTDDLLLAGFAAQYPGELAVVGDGFSLEEYGVGLSHGDEAGTAALNAALQDMIDTGAWAEALESTIGPSGFTIPTPPAVGG